MPSDLEHPASWYAATANAHPAHPALAGEVRADACVIGAGLAGLSAALHLAERGYSVVLLEAARVGWGASGRNGGQVGSGQRRGLLDLEHAFGREATRRLWALAEEAKSIVRERIERHAIRCDYRSGNLLAITKPRFVAGIAAEAEHAARHYDYADYRMLGREETRAAVASPCYCAGRLDGGGGHLHPLNYALGLADAAIAAGVCVHERTRATRIRWDTPVRVETAEGCVRAAHVLLCTNAYLEGLEPRAAGRIMPIVNHVLATEPLGAARARATIREDWCVHATKFVVDYYRFSADHRLLFGGGETYSDAPPADLAGFVRRHMLAVFPQLADARVDYAWSGRLAITVDRMPEFGRIGDAGYYVQGFSGHGVALTQIAGRLLAEAVAGTAERFDVLATLKHRRFPGGRWLRRPLLVAGMLYYALRDRL